MLIYLICYSKPLAFSVFERSRPRNVCGRFCRGPTASTERNRCQVTVSVIVIPSMAMETSTNHSPCDAQFDASH